MKVNQVILYYIIRKNKYKIDFKNTMYSISCLLKWDLITKYKILIFK